MKVDVEWRGSDLVLHITGALLAQNSDGLVAQLRGNLTPACRRCVLEVAGLTQLDSSGVGALVTCHNLAREIPVAIALAGLSGRALQAIQVAKADRFMALHPSVEAALAAR